MKCEREHISYTKLQIVRGIHKSLPPIHPSEGLWPEFIIVGMDDIRDSLVRYKLVGPEEFNAGPLMTDPYYYFHEE